MTTVSYAPTKQSRTADGVNRTSAGVGGTTAKPQSYQQASFNSKPASEPTTPTTENSGIIDPPSTQDSGWREGIKNQQQIRKGASSRFQAQQGMKSRAADLRFMNDSRSVVQVFDTDPTLIGPAPSKGETPAADAAAIRTSDSYPVEERKAAYRSMLRELINRYVKDNQSTVDWLKSGGATNN